MNSVSIFFKKIDSRFIPTAYPRLTAILKHRQQLQGKSERDWMTARQKKKKKSLLISELKFLTDTPRG